MNRGPRKTLCAALAGLMATAGSTTAATVWNVNVGNSSVGSSNAITTTDNYVGAATENTANSTWNGISNTDLTTLADSTGDNTAGVTFKITPDPSSAIDFGGQNLTTGDEIFNTWIKDNGNNDTFDITFGNLSTTASYSLVVYSDWWWGPSAVPVEQTAGTGLTGIFTINSPRLAADLVSVGTGGVGPLLEDTNAANSLDALTNYARFDGLQADGLGNLSFDMGGVDGPINGFQLVAVPEPGSLALFSLGGLMMIMRRRRS